MQTDKTIQQLVKWGEANASIQALILTSTRTVPNATLDALSDYDVIVVMTDIQPLVGERAWLEHFGRVLVLYQDPLHEVHGFLQSAYITQYESGLKIDFTLWQVERLQQIVTEAQLPDEFDAGYQVLLDKDNLTAGLPAPTYHAYIPKPPTEAEYQETIEGFFHEGTYVAKFLWRDDLLAAKHIEDFMKQEHLIPMLVWRAEIDHHWKMKPGPYGRRLKKWLSPELWAELASTYVGVDIAENWEAFFRAIALFKRVAIEVGNQLGYTYPDDLHQRMLQYFEWVRNLDPNASLGTYRDEPY
jgi:aminoglycoside 6-adenylyltransferase